MKRSSIVAAGLILSSILSSASAENRSHYQEAEKFYNLTNITADAKAMVNQIVSPMILQSPELAPHKDILSDFILEMISSEEYREIKIRSYMRYLSEDQLRELSGLFSSESYQQLRANQSAILLESNQGIQRLLRSRQSELARRIKENAQRLER